MAPSWNFIPTHKGGVQQSNAADNFFREDSANMVENLVRENIQNALDAQSGKSPVLVRFSLTSLPKDKVDYLKDLLSGQILWVSNTQLVRTAILTGIFAVVWFLWRERIGRIGFYMLFAVVVTASVQMVGVYLVFTSLIVPAVATYRYAGRRQLAIGYGLGIASFAVGLALSVVTDLPSSAMIVWTMAVLGLLVHLCANGKQAGAQEG